MAYSAIRQRSREDEPPRRRSRPRHEGQMTHEDDGDDSPRGVWSRLQRMRLREEAFRQQALSRPDARRHEDRPANFQDRPPNLEEPIQRLWLLSLQTRISAYLSASAAAQDGREEVSRGYDSIQRLSEYIAHSEDAIAGRHGDPFDTDTQTMPPPPPTYNASARQALFDEGFHIRREVTGAAHVERSWNNAPAFSRPMQELATQAAWGLIWGRPGLDRRTRSLLNVAMLVAMGKSTELGVHVKGAVQNGASVEDIQETILQASVYAGMPAGLEGFRVAQRVLDEMGVLEGEGATAGASGEGKAAGEEGKTS